MFDEIYIMIALESDKVAELMIAAMEIASDYLAVGETSMFALFEGKRQRLEDELFRRDALITGRDAGRLSRRGYDG